MKSYEAPWKGEVLLACKRCQKRLRKSKASPDFARLRKWIKWRQRRDPNSGVKPLHVIEIPCQKICPKKGIVILLQPHLAAQPARFSIICSEEQMRALYLSMNAPNASMSLNVDAPE